MNNTKGVSTNKPYCFNPMAVHLSRQNLTLSIAPAQQNSTLVPAKVGTHQSLVSKLKIQQQQI